MPEREPMTQTLKASEARAQWSQLLNKVFRRQARVIVEKSGIPVAATDVGDVRFITGGVGEVVPPKNPDLLCAGWRRLRQRLMQDPGLRNDARGRIVANYSLDTMVRRTEDVLTGLTAGRPAQEIAREFA